jgi:mono/diheme cytochrome c family protein
MSSLPLRLYDALKRTYPRWSTAAYKVALVAPFVLAVAIPLVLAGLPFNEFLNDMAAQPKGKPQGTYGRQFGQALVVDRTPASGTAATDASPYAYDYMGNEQADALWVGQRLKNPVALTMENLRRGQSRFNIYCIACHGERAGGNGPVVAGGFPAPPSLVIDPAVGYPDGTIFHIITKGTGKMPPYGDLLAEQDRWKVVHYVRALQLSARPPRHGGEANEH